MSTTETPPISLAIVPFLRFLVSMPAAELEKFCRTLMECSDQVREDVLQMFEIAEDASRAPADRIRALNTIADQLHLIPDNEGRFGMDLVASEELSASEVPALAVHVKQMNSQEAEFVERLRELMKKKQVTQEQLAERIECSQPAISQMLNRKCRPQRKTLNKIAKALDVDVRSLWPDIEISEHLDAVVAFQQDGREMTAAEAEALRGTSQPTSKIKGRPLPSRKKSQERE